MDARRFIEVVANRLQSQADIVVEGDIGTSGEEPAVRLPPRPEQLPLRHAVHRPLDQISERNGYARP